MCNFIISLFRIDGGNYYSCINCTLGIFYNFSKILRVCLVGDVNMEDKKWGRENGFLGCLIRVKYGRYKMNERKWLLRGAYIFSLSLPKSSLFNFRWF